MHLLQLTLSTPAENVALDEALLDAAEAGELPTSVLRLWEPADYFVVLGRSTSATTEVNLARCREERVPVLRRASGGGPILAGPGCLMVAVVLLREQFSDLHSVTDAHQFVLQELASALASAVPGVVRAGTSDLAFPAQGGWLVKFSGNALRIKRRALLYHGTLLYQFDVPRISRLLARPAREPAYRAGRPHEEFVGNLTLDRETLVSLLVTAWQAEPTLGDWPAARLRTIVAEKYSNVGEWFVALPG